MNDPHVEWLRYRLELGPALSITDAPPLEHETDHCRLRLDAGTLTVTMKEHHASFESAQETVDQCLRSWQVNTELTYGPGEFRFVYENGKLVDRNPPPPGSPILVPGTGVLSLTGHAALTTGATVTRHTYPAPPTDFGVSPDVETLWYRYRGYREGKEPLPHMAYFCLTVLEWIGGGGRGRGNAREAAARTLGIDIDVLNRLGGLVSEKGDPTTARKRPKGGWQPYDPRELAWIEAVIRAAIRRTGEHAAGVIPKVLTMADFPPLPK
ncbi:MAG TPA: hypothetical protein VGT40_25275 [Methylomirabilota bacterium]|nr:hypothetical protein [Methylomirabilota bacterium]